MFNPDDRSDLNRRRFIKSMAIIGGASLFAGCSSGPDGPGVDDNDAAGDGSGGTFVLSTPNEVETLDPRMNSLAWYSTAAHYLFDGLLMMAPDGSGTAPHLLENHLEEADELTYVGTLRQDVQFHDESELTAEDVAYSFGWMLDPDNASPNQADLDFISEVEASGEYEVTFHLEYPFALMETVLAGMNAPIVPQAAAEEMGEEEFGVNPVGTGPFQFVEAESASHLQTEVFEDYFLGTPRLGGLEYRIIPEAEVGYVELTTGGVHQSSIPETLLDQSETEDNIDTTRYSSFNYRGLILNCFEEPFDDARVREAMHYVVNYDELLSGSVDQLGKRNWGYLPQEVIDLWDFPYEEWEEEYYPEQDHDQAVSMLEDAGVGTDFEVDILALSGEKWMGMSVVLQNELEQIGVDASVREVGTGEWLDALDTGEFDVCTYGWGGGDDPDGYYYYMFRDLENDEGGMSDDVVGNASAGYIHQAYRGTEEEETLQRLDGIIRDARATLDQDERFDLYVEAAEIMQGYYPAIPIYAGETAVGWRTEVQDYEPTAFGDQEVFNHWQEAWIEG